jgi:uncharacterized membrane protein YkoI
VPESVKTAFKQKFPTAQKVTWELDYENYEAEFKVNKKEMSAKFDKDGNWIETETPIKPSAINPEVKEFLSKNFAGFVVKEAEKVETAAKGVVYELEVKNGEIEYELVVSEKGQLISRNDVNKDKDKKAKSQ